MQFQQFQAKNVDFEKLDVSIFGDFRSQPYVIGLADYARSIRNPLSIAVLEIFEVEVDKNKNANSEVEMCETIFLDVIENL